MPLAGTGLLPPAPIFFLPLTPSQTISLREANQNFSRVIAAVEQGEVFLITRRGQEIARLGPSGHSVKALPRTSVDAAIPLTDAALAERLRRLEALMDKLLLAVAATDKK